MLSHLVIHRTKSNNEFNYILNNGNRRNKCFTIRTRAIRILIVRVSLRASSFLICFRAVSFYQRSSKRDTLARTERIARYSFGNIVFANVPNCSIRDRVGSLAIPMEAFVASTFERFRRFSQSAFQPRCFSYRRAIGRCSRCFIACVGRSSFDRVGSLLATLFYHSHPPRLLTRFTPQILQRQKHGTLVSAAKAAKRIEEVRRVCDERIDRRNVLHRFVSLLVSLLVPLLDPLPIPPPTEASNCLVFSAKR